MIAVNSGTVRPSIFVVAALLSILPPAFAGEYENGHEEKRMAENPRHHRWFQKIDRNDNGKISREEFQTAARKKFKHLDKEGDGFITLQEWRAAAKE